MKHNGMIESDDNDCNFPSTLYCFLIVNMKRKFEKIKKKNPKNVLS